MSSTSNNGKSLLNQFPGSGAHAPEDKDKSLLQTPYGCATVIRTRRHADGTVAMREMELSDWKQADGNTGPVRPATLFSPVKFPSIVPEVGNDVVCQYGRGRVIGIRRFTEDQVAVCLSSWRLAGRSRVTCYLAASAVQVVRPKKIYEMTVFERVEFAMELKTKTAADFAAKNYESALVTYASAVDAVRYVQHKSDSSNEVRADLVVLMITCSNNAATCCTKLKKWDEADKFARNALVIIDALEPKRGKRIHKLLNESGYSDHKLFGEWRVKSCIIMATAALRKENYDDAIDILKKAREVIDKYTAQEFIKQPALRSSVNSLVANGKEVKRLHSKCKDGRRAVLKKEKSRAQAMFGSSALLFSVEEEKKEVCDSPVSQTNGAFSPEFTSESITSSEPAAGLIPESEHEPVVSVLRKPSYVEADSPSLSRSTEKECQRRVSFSSNPDEVKEFERHLRPYSDIDDDAEWYQDPEVLAGLAFFAGGLGLAVLAVNFALGRRR
jgi:tetratricopeptide (TPR) repeat protein